MSLMFSETWEQAVLAAAVKAASEAGNTGYLGRTAIQKIVYFLQVAGVPMRYSFDIYHYGPYCDRISNDIEWLMADSVVRDGSTNREKYSNYVPDTAINELLGAHPDIVKFTPIIKSVVQALLPLKPDQLELTATLDFLYRQLKAGGDVGPWKERVIDKFVQVKKDKFPRQVISDTYDNLVNAKLFKE